VSEPSNDKRSEDLQQEIEEIRDNIGGLVTELDHRRHAFFNVGAQVRRHGLSLAIAGVALVGLAAGGFWFARRRTRAQRTLPARLGRIGQALGRMVKHPERQAPPPPSAGRKILTAAGAAAASILVKRLMQRLVDERLSPAER
jgi:hypothetical protein